MPIQNYTTSINAQKTIGEITGRLVSAGVSGINTEISGGQVVAIAFYLDLPDGDRRVFRLPARPERVLATLKRDGVARAKLTIEHSRNVAWRIVRDWIFAQLALVDSGAVEMSEVFFPYLLSGDGGQETLYQRFIASGGRLALPAAPVDAEVVR